MTIHVDVVSAEESIYAGTAALVTAPALNGEVGIYPRHAPMIAKLMPGEVKIETPDGEEQHIYVSGGMLEVQPHVVTVLADTAIRADDIDEAAALESKRQAEDAITEQRAELDYARAQADLAEAVAQLRTLERLRKQAAR